MHIRTALACAALATLPCAQASQVLLTSGGDFQSALGSAEAYRSAVDGALAGLPSTLLDSYQGVSTSAGATRVDIAFVVPQALAGRWDFRFGVDFGGGGAVFVDGAAVAYNPNDLWWDGRYDDPSQSFQFSGTLGAGAHTISLYGFEACCTGATEGAFLAPATAGFQVFGLHDGLAPVPEPAAAWLALGGALVLALRRKAAARAAQNGR